MGSSALLVKKGSLAVGALPKSLGNEGSGFCLSARFTKTAEEPLNDVIILAVFVALRGSIDECAPVNVAVTF